MSHPHDLDPDVMQGKKENTKMARNLADFGQALRPVGDWWLRKQQERTAAWKNRHMPEQPRADL